MRSLHTLLAGGAFFEGPRWHDGRWWVSDIFGHRVSAVDTRGQEEEAMTVEGQPSGLGWMPDGSLLVVSMTDHRILRRSPTGRVTTHADIARFCGGWANDMVVDQAGRAYVGNLGSDLFAGADPQPATLVRVDPDGSAVIAADALRLPNGIVLTPDGRTLIVGETMGGRYTAFDVAADGSLSGRRPWAEQLPFGPDGCCLDADGYIWCATTRSRCCRIAPGGQIVDEVPLPDELRAYACMLGGEDGRTLLICAAPSVMRASRDPSLREAVLLTTTVDVPHAGLP
jgi:sugar lactone lactonase YvrE